ncbi:MAG: hypothetical protein J6B35_07520 [Clostridia bacterium]|nr:hypothetical protein [Clostridia bacterium]
MIGTGEEEVINLDNLADGLSEIRPVKRKKEPVKMKAGVIILLIIAILILLVAVFYAVVIKSDIEIFDRLREFITESYAYKWAIENLIPEKIYEFLK